MKRLEERLPAQTSARICTIQPAWDTASSHLLFWDTHLETHIQIRKRLCPWWCTAHAHECDHSRADPHAVASSCEPANVSSQHGQLSRWRVLCA